MTLLLLSLALIILVFILFINLAFKVEDHLKYVKILEPDRFKQIETFAKDSGKLDFTMGFILMMPIFPNRDLSAEKEDQNLKRLGLKVYLRCKQIWIALGSIVIDIILIIVYKSTM